MQLELLAPAKNKDIGIAAIDCGADALYIAGPAFGARKAAGNTFSDIEALAKYAHRYGVRVYMTVNTILYDEELEKAQKVIIKGYEAGCDALIVQDLGVLKLDLPPIDLYASTQTNIRTPEQARFLESLGFKRLILARELSLKQIKAIREATSCELESFVHGALCVSYSGQCYLSSHLTGRSANRGECIQACRSNYDLVDSQGRVLLKNKPILSLKDFSLAEYIPQLVDAGISSFKIEGRLKNESYVKNITRHYRKIIDSYGYPKSSYGEITGGFVPNIHQTFSRGYTTYFITGQREKWNSGESAKATGEHIGKVSSVRKNSILYEGKSLNNGDGLHIITPKGESIGIRADKVEGNVIFVKEVSEITPGSTIYRNYNHKFEKEVENNTPKRVLDVVVNISASESEIVAEAICENGIKVNYTYTNSDSAPFAQANNRELALGNLKVQLSKTTSFLKFRFGNFASDGGFVPFLPLSALNSIRRELSELIESEISCKEERQNYPLSKHIFTLPITPPQQRIKLNCSNHLSRELYSSVGIQAADAFELDRENPSEEYSELMRTKYCIRHELGLCGKKISEPLYLINNGKRLRLQFDCRNCEMTIHKG